MPDQDLLPELRVDHLDCELGGGTACRTSPALPAPWRSFEDLFVDVAEQVPGRRLVEVDVGVELVDHLAEQGAVLHVVEGVLEHAAQERATFACSCRSSSRGRVPSAWGRAGSRRGRSAPHRWGRPCRGRPGRPTPTSGGPSGSVRRSARSQSPLPARGRCRS